MLWRRRFFLYVGGQVEVDDVFSPLSVILNWHRVFSERDVYSAARRAISLAVRSFFTFPAPLHAAATFALAELHRHRTLRTELGLTDT